MKKIAREYVLITVGSIMVAFGIYYFLSPGNLAAGGVSGLAMVIKNFLPGVSLGLLTLGMNTILLIIGFLVIGSRFGAKTIYATLGYNAIIWAFEKFAPVKKPFTDDLLVMLIFGILISGVGMGIIFNQNASTGGTDIIAKIINKFMHLDIGKSLLLSDFVITLLAGLTFGAKTGLYALLGVIINGFVIDEVIEGFSICKQVTIISSRGEEIRDFIIKELERGATIYTAMGAYTGEQRDVLITVMSRKEFIRLRGFIKEIDRRAFITLSNVHEVLGEGFKDIDF